MWDVVVDIRRSSPTFGEWEAFELDDERHLQLYVPIGFAHGFCALSEVVERAFLNLMPPEHYHHTMEHALGKGTG